MFDLCEFYSIFILSAMYEMSLMKVCELVSKIKCGSEKERLQALYRAEISGAYTHDNCKNMAQWLKCRFEGYHPQLSRELNLAKLQVLYFGFDNIGVVELPKVALLAKLKSDRDKKAVIKDFDGIEGLKAESHDSLRSHITRYYLVDSARYRKTNEQKLEEITASFLDAFEWLPPDRQLDVVIKVNEKFEKLPEFALRTIVNKLSQLESSLTEVNQALTDTAYFIRSPDLYAYTESPIEHDDDWE